MTLSDLELFAEASDKLEKMLLVLLPDWVKLDSCELEMVPPDRELIATVFCRSQTGVRCTLSMEVYGLKRSELRHLSRSIHKRILEWYGTKT